MASIGSRLRATFVMFGAVALIIVSAATAAWAIESEGEMISRDRLVGNLGVAHADVGVYPDRAVTNPSPERSSGSDTLTIPAGAEVIDAVVYWAGRGPGWSDDQIIVNGTAVTADIDYSWSSEGWDQTTYVADLDDAGLTFTPGTSTVDISGLDQKGERFYGAGVIVIYEDSSLPEVELELFEGNEFAFFLDTFADDIGNSAEHTNVSCQVFAPSVEDRSITSFSRIMGVDAGRSDAPPRTQRLQWWTGTEAVTAPVVDGIVGIPDAAPAGSVDNPVAAKVPVTEQWGSDVYETQVDLPAGATHLCTQLQSVSIGDGAGASLSLTNQGASGETVHRIGNLVWLDSNEDGMADAGEPGIDGVTVELIKVGTTDPIATTTTSNDGEYLFDGLLCGTYKVVIPGSQTGWAVAGEAVDAADIMPGMINNPNANDDSDNDNNGVADGDMLMSGEVEIGDCGDDGDFSNSASNEPTNETDRKGGPDDDADEVSVIDGNYDDVRSNVSVDFSFVSNTCVANDDGTFPADAVNADGEPCSECDTADPAPGAVDADGELCNPCDADTPAADAVGPDGEPCNPCNVTNPAPGVVDADGEPCNPCDAADPAPGAVDADGELCNPCDADTPAADAVGPDGEPCNPCDAADPAPGAVDADGVPCTPCADADAAQNGVNADGEPCNPCHDNAGPDAVDADGELCNPCDADNPAADAVGPDGEPCSPCNVTNPAPGAVDADGELCNPCDADNPAADAVGPDGEPCSPCNVTNPAPGAVDADGVPCTPCEDADAAQNGVNADGEPCNPCHDNAGPDAVDADGEPCDEPVTVEVDGLVECPADSDRAGVEVQPGESCDNVCDEDGNVTAANTPGTSTDNCTEEEVTTEVEGIVEENPDVPGTDIGDQAQIDGDTTGDQAQVPGDTADDQAQQPAPADLAATGAWSVLVMLAALMLVVLGAWFFVAGVWMRPAAAHKD